MSMVNFDKVQVLIENFISPGDGEQFSKSRFWDLEKLGEVLKKTSVSLEKDRWKSLEKDSWC